MSHSSLTLLETFTISCWRHRQSSLGSRCVTVDVYLVSVSLGGQLQLYIEQKSRNLDYTVTETWQFSILFFVKSKIFLRVVYSYFKCISH